MKVDGYPQAIARLEAELGPINAPDRQAGRFSCGRPNLVDQPRTVVQTDLSRLPSVKNAAYIHKTCEQSQTAASVTLTFKEAETGRSKLVIPKTLTKQKLPYNAILELQQQMAYIIKKYELWYSF